MNTTKTIVIADDDAALVEALRKRCESLSLRVHTAFDALSALNIIHESKPDLVCLDVNMPCGDGLSVLQMLTSDEHFRSKPVIIMTGDANQETVRCCHNHCAYYVEKCVDVWPRIEPLIRELLDVNHPPAAQKPYPAQIAPNAGLRSGEVLSASPVFVSDHVPGTTDRRHHESAITTSPVRNKLVETVFEMLGAEPRFLDLQARPEDDAQECPWVLCIDDDADYSHALKLRLERYGIAVVRAFEGMEGVRFAFTKPADVILLDYEMPNGQGDYVLRRLKDNPITEGIPVIMITGKKDRMLERRVLNMGAAKFINKPPVFDELLDELRRYIDILPQPLSS